MSPIDTLYHQFHNRVKELTGDPWCPYPSTQFMEWTIGAEDPDALQAIEHRRTLPFPAFLAKEPQEHLWGNT